MVSASVAPLKQYSKDTKTNCEYGVMVNKPKQGDHVTFTDTYDITWNGVVVDLLSKQFTADCNGTIRYVFYTDEWRKL